MDIDDLLDADPEQWKPEVGDRVSGEVVSVTEKSGYEGHAFKAYTLRTRAGDFVDVCAWHSTLAQELELVHVGDEIAVRYDGVPAGKKYHKYKVVVQSRSRGGNSTPEE